MPQVSFESSHNESYDRNSNTYTMDKGEFVLKDDLGNEIFGTYDGEVEVNGRLRGTIIGGTGKFAQKQGTLTLTISRYTLENDGLITSFCVRFIGSSADLDQS